MSEQTPADPVKEETIFDESEFSMEGYDKHVRNARISLFVLAGLLLLSLFLQPHMEGPQWWAVIGLTVALALIFAAMGWWSKKNPYAALWTALSIFIVWQVFNGIADPASLLQAWLIKVAVIVMLIQGIRNAKEIKDRKEAFGQQD